MLECVTGSWSAPPVLRGFKGAIKALNGTHSYVEARIPLDCYATSKHTSNTMRKYVFTITGFCVGWNSIVLSAPIDSGDNVFISTSVTTSSEKFSVTASPTSTAKPEFETDIPATSFLNSQPYVQGTDANPEPMNDGLGASSIAPDDTAIDQQNPDLFAPPTTDNNIIQNAKWPISLGHTRLQSGGWSRQQNTDDFPIGTSLASVQMRLEAGAIRELHWHSSAEWGFVLDGNVKLTAMDNEGRVFVDTVGPEDLWYFPAGVPHSIQVTDQNPEGSEFLLVFDDGSFSDDGTFLLTDWMAHVPMEVLTKNFQLDESALSKIPSKQLYIFPGEPPSPDEPAPTSPSGEVPNPYSFHLSSMKETKLSGGSIKSFDSTNFKVSTTIVGSLVTVEPGGMRELHWHPTQPEWDYILQGQARMTIFAAQETANTFDYQAGDIGYVPPSFGHYIENTGNSTLRYLEIFNSDLVQDFSLQQWLALTPPDLVAAHLGFSKETIAHLSKTKMTVIGKS
ncbi:Bicupin, oxalate decarboxylase/oxidase [Schizopora paradoxa]|uniref:Bicupin, oxalate decarboxylase/oxidase n=1 Tax=Schizopora paradoxa TaxID=27342 RepID=A0A0H2S0E4_9AGAM|nr:Bicupin, oxalate decarboxylase/oxidase [Schizopora paradoxa]